YCQHLSLPSFPPRRSSDLPRPGPFEGQARTSIHHIFLEHRMSEPVYNFGAGPAMLPFPVMQRIREELLDYRGMGVSVIEISHRSKEFEALLTHCDTLI